ncbi:MAG: 1-acyl-sn-glycerol-3-phosphate acyltransferase [Actinomycetota bacterium]|nr:1-acyl-sn-glycerol-3-phosphate acyltransferase [Actinomycetota bacterium]
MAEEGGGGKKHGVFRRMARGAANLVYREIDVRLPVEPVPDGPVMAVSNHFGGLSDGVLLVDASPRMPRVVARDVIWKVPIAGRLATAAGMIPVHKAADGGSRASNDEMFASAYSALGDGDLVLIFPEGVTQDVPHMAEVRTGAARIVLGARASGVEGISIVPVGLHYENKAGFRSRALVNIGEAISLDQWVASRGEVVDGADDREAVRELTELVNVELRHVAPDYPDWDQAHALETVSGVLLTDVDASEKPPMRYGDQALLASRLNRVAGPDREQLVDLGGTYRSRIEAAQTSDHAIATAAAPQPRSWGWVRDVLLVLLMAPFALFGLFAAAIPLLLVLIASKLRIAPAVRATIVPGLAVLLFGVEWVLVAIAVGRDLGGEAAVAAVALFPFFVGALFLEVEKVNLLWNQWRRRRRPSPDELPELQALRSELGEKAWAEL